MMNQFRVLVLGHGEMGQAMEYLLGQRQRLDIWEKFSKDNFQSVLLENAAPAADIVLFCLPVIPHREIIEYIAPLLKKNCLCVSIAKGLDEAGQTAAQIFANVLAPDQAYALLYGPMISEEIRADRFAFAQLGSVDKACFNKVRDLFHGTPVYIEYTEDISGISWSVILKNVYAIVFGIADELQLGDNMRGFLSVAALRELDQIVRKMGGRAGSSYHLAGLGDLIATGTSEESHHHALGRKLAKGETQGIEGEGVHTLEMVSKYQLLNETEFPLFQLIRNIVKAPVDVHKQIKTYLEKVCH